MDRRVGTYKVEVTIDVPFEDDSVSVDVTGVVEVEDYGIGRHEYGWHTDVRSEVVRMDWDRRGWNSGDESLVDAWIEENYDEVCKSLIREVEVDW